MNVGAVGELVVAGLEEQLDRLGGEEVVELVVQGGGGEPDGVPLVDGEGVEVRHGERVSDAAELRDLRLIDPALWGTVFGVEAAPNIPTMPRTDSAARVIDAPVARVFNALVEREALESWLPPGGMTARFERFDPRPGGSYRLVLTYLDPTDSRGKSSADSDIVEARYVDIVANDCVVQAVDFVSDDPAFAGTMTMTWAVRAVGGGTRVEITADHVPDGISADDHAADCPPRSTTSLATWSRSELKLASHVSEPAFGGSYRSDDLCATAACEPRPSRALGADDANCRPESSDTT